MNEQVDPRLLKYLDNLKDHEVGDAIIAFQLDGTEPDAATTAQAMLDQARDVVGVAPTVARILPKLGAMHVSGSRAFLKQLLCDERVNAASLGSADE